MGIYTPLPFRPFLPNEVAEELVKWLEGLLKQAVKKVVKRERRGSSGSADSKGQSSEPEGSGREELPERHWAVQEVVKAEVVEEADLGIAGLEHQKRQLWTNYLLGSGASIEGVPFMLYSISLWREAISTRAEMPLWGGIMWFHIGMDSKICHPVPYGTQGAPRPQITRPKKAVTTLVG
ncbi:hypothetical protein BGX38DRAFT_1261080 [Terfezia claveryi]|nr:hypothetical protein BGX38DRAFT_1261080 [Terfezia claveryi]